jgi:hypothetical protein
METKTRLVTDREGIAGSDDGARSEKHHRFGQVARERLRFARSQSTSGQTNEIHFLERDEGSV